MSTYSRPGVYVSESLLPSASIQNAATADAAGAAVGCFPKGPQDLTLVGSWYEFTSIFGGLDSAYPATYQVQSFFLNGGRDLYVVRMLAADSVKAAVVIPKDGTANAAVTLTARNAGADGNNLRVKVSAGSSAGKYDIAILAEVSGVSALVPREIHTDVVVTEGASANIATVINAESSLVTAEVNDATAALDLGTLPFASGSNGSAVDKSDYVPATGANIFAKLTTASRPLVLFLPSLHSDVSLSADREEIYSSAVAWAEDNYGFLVADTPSGLTSATAVSYKGELPASSYTALYWPTVLIRDPMGRSRSSLRHMSPGGAVAGLYLGTDATQGVFKTPAGMTAALTNIVSLEAPLTAGDLDALYAGGVNAIRNLPGAGGPVVFGGKTTKAERTVDQNISARRSLNYLEKSLGDITEFAVFENNNANLWARLSTVVSVFLGNFWRAGGLEGATEATAFYVKCDAENNTLTSVQNGEVHIEVGVALQYPAEFVVIRLSQQTA